MDNNGEYTFLNTKAFDAFIEQKESILQRYNEINSTYDEIVVEQHTLFVETPFERDTACGEGNAYQLSLVRIY